MHDPGYDERNDGALAALIDEFYAIISGPAGPRDWSRERAILHPQARLMRTGVDETGLEAARQGLTEAKSEASESQRAGALASVRSGMTSPTFKPMI